jgi:hypothetical protein
MKLYPSIAINIVKEAPQMPKVDKSAPEMAKLPKVISSLKFSERFCPLSSQKREL